MPDLYSNCVILEFAGPLTRAHLDEISERIANPPILRTVKLPMLRQAPICAEREGNVVVPTIAADEC